MVQRSRSKTHYKCRYPARGIEMKITKLWLKKHGACNDGAVWFNATFPDGATPDQIIAKIQRADWLLWYARNAKFFSRLQYVKLACICARTSLKYVKKGEDRPKKCIETVEAYIIGGATIEQVRI